MFPCSNTPDLNDQLVIKLCWSLITTGSFESGVLGQGAHKHWNKPRQSFIEVAYDIYREIYFLGEVRGEKNVALLMWWDKNDVKAGGEQDGLVENRLLMQFETFEGNNKTQFSFFSLFTVKKL